MHPYNSIDVTAAWKRLRFILSVRSDFHMIESLSLAVHAFVSRVSMSFSADAKSSLYIYIRYIWFSLVKYYGISTSVGYLMPNILFCIYLIYIIWLGWVLWHINHCGLFTAKYFLYVYIKYIWFSWVSFYGISIIVGYLIPNPLYHHHHVTPPAWSFLAHSRHPSLSYIDPRRSSSVHPVSGQSCCI